jgi:hypothetical protein
MVYESCGLFGLVGVKEFQLSSVCGTGTAFQDGKCVSTVDVASDNASVCGTGTAFKDGKCVSFMTFNKASVCGTGTVFRDDKCVIDFGEDLLVDLSAGPEPGVNHNIIENRYEEDGLKVPRRIKIDVKSRIDGMFEDIAAGEFMRATPRKLRGDVYDCFYDTTKKLAEGSKMDRSKKLLLYDALKGEKNEKWDVVWGPHGVFNHCLTHYGK